MLTFIEFYEPFCMDKNMKNFLLKLPLPLAGLMLASASLGNLLQSYGNTIRYIFGFISLILFILLTLKIIVFPKNIIDELKNPVIGSVFPTYSMGIMILSIYAKLFSYGFGLFLFYIGLILHILIMLNFIRNFIFKFDIKKVYPSYFVPLVGIVVGSIAAPNFSLNKLGMILFYFGFISYFILLPIILYRVVKIKNMPEPTIPTIAIFAAPPSLCLTGYLSSFEEKNYGLVIFIIIIALISTVSVLIYLYKILSLKFYPSFSGITFPLVISGIGAKMCNVYFTKINKPLAILTPIVKFYEIIATIIVLFVLYKYIIFLLPTLKKSSTYSVKS